LVYGMRFRLARNQASCLSVGVVCLGIGVNT
jgi:hypothetical protein